MWTTVASSILCRDGLIVIVILGGAIVLAWSHLLLGAGMDFQAMGGMAMQPSTPVFFLLVVLMWAVMMVAMMLPSAAPMILLYRAIVQRGRTRRGALGATALFGLGYIVVWTSFSLGAAILQWGLATAALLSPVMRTTNVALAGLLLITAGIHQVTPAKQSCLRWCRSPLDFMVRHWRDGWRGALLMGLRHGLFCLGCCWALMLVLFVTGVMNLAWIGVLALLILVEKVVPGGRRLGQAAGIALIAWGGATLIWSTFPSP